MVGGQADWDRQACPAPANKEQSSYQQLPFLGSEFHFHRGNCEKEINEGFEALEQNGMGRYHVCHIETRLGPPHARSHI